MSIKFDDTWMLYGHLLELNDWTDSSYRVLGTISTIEEFWDVMYHDLSHSQFEVNFIFLFRKGVKPRWEDKRNIGQYSFIINRPKSKERYIEYPYNQFTLISMGILGNHMFGEENGKKVNGISISYDKKRKSYKTNIYVNEKIYDIDRIVNQEYFNGKNFMFYWKEF